MLCLPVVFLCNTLLFLTILNGRFRMATSLIASGAAYVLSLLLNLLLSPAFNDVSGQIGNGMNVFLLLAAGHDRNHVVFAAVSYTHLTLPTKRIV